MRIILLFGILAFSPTLFAQNKCAFDAQYQNLDSLGKIGVLGKKVKAVNKNELDFLFNGNRAIVKNYICESYGINIKIQFDSAVGQKQILEESLKLVKLVLKPEDFETFRNNFNNKALSNYTKSKKVLISVPDIFFVSYTISLKKRDNIQLLDISMYYN